MIKIPFLPQYQIILSDRHDGPFHKKGLITSFLHQHIPKKEIAHLTLAHGSHCQIWEEKPTDESSDAVITRNTDLVLSMVVGDCFPIIIIDPKHHTMAMIHGGWRSLLQNIISLTFHQLTQSFRCEPEELVAWIGPGLRECSNLMKTPPIQSLFPEWKNFVKKTEDGYSVDLVGYIRDNLIHNGMKDENIFDYGKCTYCEKDSFFSHRRSTLEEDEEGRFIVSVYRK